MKRERAGDVYYHRMVLSPASNETVSDWKAWTRAVMKDLSQRLGKPFDWYAMHHANTDNPHIHLVVSGTSINRDTEHTEPVTFNPQDFKFLRDRGREHSEYEQYRFMTETLRELNERDTVSNETPAFQRDPRQSEPGAYADFGR